MNLLNAQIEGRALRLNLYGPIGQNPLMGGGGITAAMVAEEVIDAGEVDQLDVYINSPGGDVFEGIAIYNELKQFQGQVNVYVMGVAASIASIIAMAGDNRIMYDGAEFMIHQASGVTFGTADQHAKQAKTLRRLDKKLADIYAATTGNDAGIIAEMMTEETWFDADDAMKDGFATHVSPLEAVKPPNAALLNQYQNVPLKVAVLVDQQASGELPESTAKESNMETEHDKTENMEEEETLEALKAENAELKAKIQAMEEEPAEEEELEAMDDEEKEEAAAAALTTEFIGQAMDMIKNLKAENSQLAELLNGEQELSLGSGDDGRDDSTRNIYKAAKKLPNKYAREAYLASVGADVADFDRWAETH